MSTVKSIVAIVSQNHVGIFGNRHWLECICRRLANVRLGQRYFIDQSLTITDFKGLAWQADNAKYPRIVVPRISPECGRRRRKRHDIAPLGIRISINIWRNQKAIVDLESWLHRTAKYGEGSGYRAHTTVVQATSSPPDRASPIFRPINFVDDRNRSE